MLRHQISHLDINADPLYIGKHEDAITKDVHLQSDRLLPLMSDCSLIDANFSNADLLNTSFKGCDLEGALFAGATNIPDNIRCKLDKKGVYRSDFIESQYINNDSSKMVFVSCIGNLNPHQKDCINYISNHLKSHNITPIRYCREDYRSSGQINVIRGEMSKCKGVIIIGFKSIVINSAIYRPNTGDRKSVV